MNLAKRLATGILPQLEPEVSVTGHDPSTTGLINAYKKMTEGSGSSVENISESIRTKTWIWIGRVVALTLQPFIWTLIGLFAIWIKLDSSGPVFFRQERVGRYRRPILMTKLRTMTTTNLPVPTTFGKLIRPTGLDDFLTQTWSVVKGDMVWFGPLPHPEEEMTPAFRSRILSQTAPGIIPSTVHRYGIGRGRLADESIDRDIEDETHHIKHESVFYNTKLFFRLFGLQSKV